MPLIVVEGMDNSGKSTLVKRLWKAAPRRTWMLASQSCKDDMETMWRMQSTIHVVKEALKGRYEFNVLLDRTQVVSEQIYGPIIRGQSMFGDSWRMFWTRLLKFKPLFIYCRPSREVMLGSLTDRDQMEGVDEHSDKLITAYDKFFAERIDQEELKMIENIILYSWPEDPDAGELIKELKERGYLL